MKVVDERLLAGAPASLYTLFLPLNHNDGRGMQSDRLKWAQEEILNYGVGLTLGSPGIGLWPDRTGKVCRDRMLPLQAVASIGPEAEIWFAHLAAQLAVVLEQHQIFLFAQPVYLVKPARSGKLSIE